MKRMGLGTLVVLLAVSLSSLAVSTPADAAIMDQVYSGCVSTLGTLPAGCTAFGGAASTQVTLAGVDATKAFATCTTRTTRTVDSTGLPSCQLSQSGNDAVLTIAFNAAPGNNTTTVQYHVAVFRAGVSVQRGSAAMGNADLTPPVTPALAAVDCTKSFVVSSLRNASTSTSADEQGTARVILGTAAAPCTSGTTTSLDISRNEGGTASTVEWQVVTYEGASVQRGTSCIGGSGATPACPTAPGASNGLNNRIPSSTTTAGITAGSVSIPVGSTSGFPASGTAYLNGTDDFTYTGKTGTSFTGVAGIGQSYGSGTPVSQLAAVNTAKSFILHTAKGQTSVAGVEGYHRTRAEFVATGSAVTGVQFVRTTSSTSNQRGMDIAWEVVQLNDGSSVQTSGTSPTSIGSGSLTATSVNLTTVDVTRSVPLISVSGGSGTTATYFDDTSVTVALNGGVGSSNNSNLTFTRSASSVTDSVAWFVVSFFRCSTASGVAHDSLCVVGASNSGDVGVVNWSSVNPVVVVAGTTAIGTSPTDGVTYCAGGPGCTGSTSLGGAIVVYPPGDVGTATDFAVTRTGLTAGQTYFYKVWARSDTPVGTCTTPPCYLGGSGGMGAGGSLTARTDQGTAVVAGGAPLNPVIGGIATVTAGLGSNARTLLMLDGAAATPQWSARAVSTEDAIQAYVSSITRSDTGTDAMIFADQSGSVYSVNPATGAIDWQTKVNATTVQAAVTVWVRAYSTDATMAANYPGTYDIVYVASANPPSAGYTNNKIFALRADTGALLWTFSPQAIAYGDCPSGCPMDRVLGQPALDYERSRLYIASRYGNNGLQNSLWILDVASNPPTLLKVYSGANFTTAPTQSSDGQKVFIGDVGGKLHVLSNLDVVDASNPIRTQTPIQNGVSFTSFVWEDFFVPYRLYWVMNDGNVWAYDEPDGTTVWAPVNPSPTGTTNQMLLGLTSLYVGATDGQLYQLDLATGATTRVFQAGDGTQSVGPVTTGTGSEVYATTGSAVYRVTLTPDGDLP